jgi:hypothetical protein
MAVRWREQQCYAFAQLPERLRSFEPSLLFSTTFLCYNVRMTDLMEKALAAVGNWPTARQNEAAEMLLALDRLGETYHASDEELSAIGEALAQAGRGEFATEAEVEAAFARFRR